MPKQIVSSALVKESAWLLVQAALSNAVAFSKAVVNDANVVIVIKDSVYINVATVSEIARFDPRVAAAVDAIQWIHRSNKFGLDSYGTQPWRMKMFLAGAVMPLDQEPPTFGSLKRRHGLAGVAYKIRVLHYVSGDTTLSGKPNVEVHIA